MYIYKQIKGQSPGLPFSLYIYIYAAISKRKTEAQAFSSFRLPFAHCANGSLSVLR